MNKYNNSLEILQALVDRKFSSKEEFIGIIATAIYSRDVFVKNDDAAKFIRIVFGLSFLDYVIKSRTLLCARLTRNLVSMSDKDLYDTAHKVSDYFKTDRYIIDYNIKLHTFNKINKKNKNNASRDVGTWINALLKRDKK